MTKVKKISPEKEHATYSASGARRWMNCYGSIKLSEKAPSRPDSPSAREGTEAHECFEFLLKNHDHIEEAVKMASKKYSKDMVNHAVEAVAWIVSQPAGEILSEKKVNSSAFLRDGEFGTLDAAIVREFDRLTVIDYKYGAGNIVEPVDENGEANPQLVYYALALSFEYAHNFSEVELVIIQPRAYHESGEIVRSFVMPVDKMLKWQLGFNYAMKECEKPNAPLNAGDWCKFCPAVTICPEMKTESLKRAQITFDDVTGLVKAPEPKLIKLPNLSKALIAADRLEDWIKAVRDHAEFVLKSGGEIEGFKLVNKRSTRQWLDAEMVLKEAKRKFGDKALTEPELKSPAQLEKVVGKDWVNKFTTNISSGVTLVSESDKRPAVKPLDQVFT